MKILQVIPYFCFGGAETMCENLSYALRELGHAVSVVSLYGERTPISERMERSGISIRYLDKKLGLDISMVSKLRKIMAEEKPDVVHTHLDVIKYAVAAAKLAGIRACVHTVHNVADQEAEGRLQKIINGTYFRLGWSVPVALSPEVRSSMVNFYGIPEEKIPVIYNGVNLSRCMVKERYEGNRELLHIGRFNEQKNHAGLLDAFRKVLSRHPQCRLTLVGDGELRQEVECHVEVLGLSHAVVFAGQQDNVYPYLQKADIFVLPSKYEGMPMTIIEAMGTGLPIVASKVGGVPDMITSEENGLLVPLETDAVAAALCRLLEDEALRSRLGENARRESEKFSSQAMARAYERVYQGDRL